MLESKGENFDCVCQVILHVYEVCFEKAGNVSREAVGIVH